MATRLIQCSVLSILRDTVVTALDRVAHKPVEVDLVIADETVYTVSDPEKLRQIALALLNNAVRSTERGRIALILGRDGHCLKLTVTDTGTGMAKDVLARWNSPSPGDFSRRRGGKHIGPELVMTRKLVELLGGGISISSRPGVGTIVEVWLPLIENRQKKVASVPLEMSVCHA
jgi:signal transduction histidine kinase